MARITLEVVDGADQGRIFADLPTPVTIGREEGNTIQLNDERISRFHLKIQEDHDQLVLTDLESTNGTKVNGEVTQLRILRFGDMISLGRSVLRFGSREQIAQRLANLRDAIDDDSLTLGAEDADSSAGMSSLDFELQWSDAPGERAALNTLLPPELPARLSPGQAAQLAELLEYFHVRLRDLLASVSVESVEKGGKEEERVVLNLRQWQNLFDLQARLAELLRSISEPPDVSDDADATSGD